MIFNDDDLSYFLFLDEENKTVTAKTKLYIYYAPDRSSTERPLQLLLVPLAPEGSVKTDRTSTPQSGGGTQEVAAKGTKIRISYAKTLKQAEACKAVFSRCVTIYLERAAAVQKIYRSLISNFAVSVKKSIVKTIDMKTGRRALQLRQTYPDMFMANYPTKCQKERQPY
jgi:hypothetical protein